MKNASKLIAKLRMPTEADEESATRGPKPNAEADPDFDPAYEAGADEEGEELPAAKSLLDASDEELRAELAKRASAKKPPFGADMGAEEDEAAEDDEAEEEDEDVY
jgi:hypothetical protein